MKYRSAVIAVLILSITSISLASCAKDASPEAAIEETAEENAMSLEEEMEAIEREAEETRQMLIESLKATASSPDTLRSVSGNEIDLDATGNSSEADENNEVHNEGKEN